MFISEHPRRTPGAAGNRRRFGGNRNQTMPQAHNPCHPKMVLEGSRLINCRKLPCQVDVFRSSSMTDVALLIWLETTPLQNKPKIAICLVCFSSAGISWQRSRHVTLRWAEVLHRWSRRIEFNLSICCWTFFWIFEMQSKGPQGFQIFFPVLEMLKQSEVERQSL